MINGQAIGFSQNKKESELCVYLMPAMQKTHFLVDPRSSRASVFLKGNK
jgi:hypothetical protein